MSRNTPLRPARPGHRQAPAGEPGDQGRSCLLRFGKGVCGGAAYGGYKRTPELTAFHDLIVNKRTPEACAVSAELKTAAAAIVKAPSPLGSDALPMWSREANELAGIAED